MDRDHNYPNLTQAIILILLFWGLSVLWGILVAILGKVFGFPFEKEPMVLGISNLIVFGIILVIGYRKTGATVREVFPLLPIQPVLLLPMTIMIVGMSILVSEMDNLLRLFLPAPEWLTKMMTDLVSGKTNFWSSFALLVVVAPLTEEPLFRGLILRGFLGHYSKSKAVFVTAILFAIIHLNPWQFIGALLLGVIFGWWFVQTRSLIPCLFGHAVFNAFPLILSATVKIPGYTIGPNTFQPLWFDILGLVLVGIGGLALISAFQKTDDSRPEDSSDEGVP
jgi:membrane protease YdiL (CAAX protease family)